MARIINLKQIDKRFPEQNENGLMSKSSKETPGAIQAGQLRTQLYF